MTVSAIIPVRDGFKYVAEAIDSCLGQSMPPVEIIVVDDGSNDETAALVTARAFPTVRLIRQDWSGTGSAMDNGVAAASPQTEFVAFLDHDDIWVKNRLEIQLECLAANRDLEAVFGHIQQFISADAMDDLRGRVVVPATPQPGIAASALLIRKAALQRIGPFSSRRNAFAFPPWYGKAVRLGLRYAVLPEIVALRRIHHTNAGRSEPDHYRREYLQLAREMIVSRRGNPTGKVVGR